ncbi:MAG TPA: phosphonate ABC transporter ATP-binding protein [Methylomirabilota bacterium]|nr:phosphonate ABC transporter ATP-binding protein [Methylomirabilota bacterium]
MARPGTGAGTIDLVGVAKTYVGGTVALRQVDLHVDRGEIVALLGPSGAGKSTLLRCMNGLVRPTTGQVQVDGLTVDGEESTLRRVRQRAAMIFQQFNLVGRLSALENVLTARLSYRPVLPTLFRRFPPEDYERAVRCLRRVGLAERAGQRADTLSGGERQRVAIARALAQEPAILLADEPVASLDPRSTHQVLELIRRVSREDGLTVLMSLHQVELARQFSDRVAGLASGRLVFEGHPDRMDASALAAIYGGRLEQEDHDDRADPVAVMAHA